MTVSRRGRIGKFSSLAVLRVFDWLLHKHGETITNISEKSGISLATTYRAVEFLHANKFVKTLEKVVSKNGRRPTSYSVNPDYAYSLCIVLEKTCFSIFLVDLLGCIRSRNDIPVRSCDSRELLLASIQKGIVSMLTTSGIEDVPFLKVKSIHISAQADVDSNAGRIVRFSGMKSLDNFDIADCFEEKYGIPVLVTKLLHIEAVASCKNYEQNRYSQYVYLHIGVGLGATIIAEGRVNTGATGKAGELIQIRNDDGVSWEEAYSIESLFRSVHLCLTRPERVGFLPELGEEKSGASQFTNNADLMMRIIEEQLSKGNSDVEMLVRKAAIGWARIINTIHGLLDPEAIIVGGVIGSRTPLTFRFLAEIVHEKYEGTCILLPSDRDADLHEVIASFSLEALHSLVKSDVCDKWK